MQNLRPFPSADSSTWSLGQGEFEGRPTLLRFRPELEPYLGDARWSRRLLVQWAFSDDDSSGMPTPEEAQRMEELENRLVVAFERNEVGILTIVYTSAGAREWTYYVAATADLGQIINDALSANGELPISLAVADDEEWFELRNLYASVKY